MKRRLLLTCSLILSVVSCSEPKWYSVEVMTNIVPIATSVNEKVTPFNTVMKLNYCLSEENNNDSFKEELSSYYIDEVVKYHKLFDRHYSYYDEDGKTLVVNPKTINDSYGSSTPIKCSKELYNLLKQGVNLTLKTNGYFNFFAGELVSYWDNLISTVNNFENEHGSYTNIKDYFNDYEPYYNEEARKKVEYLTLSTPSLEEVKNLLTFNDETLEVTFNTLDDIVLEDGTILERSSSTSLYRPSITTGGIGKGLATDYIKQDLISKNYTQGWLSSGSSSLTTLSDPTFGDGNKQKITLTIPENKYPYFLTYGLSIASSKDYSISTSGNHDSGHSYTLYDDNNNVLSRRHHIINPYTGYPSEDFSTVLLFSHSFTGVELDAFSTAFVNMSLKEGLEFRTELLKDTSKDLEIVFVSNLDENNNYNYYATSNFEGSLEILQDYFKEIKL